MDEWNIRELPAVPETVPIARLLETLQEKRTEICVVIDEHGGTAGIVTMSDVMEQIVGRIDDEYVHDLADEAKTLDDGSYLIDGALPIGELEEILEFTPEEADEVETAGGLLLALFDRIPDEGGRRDPRASLDHGDVHRFGHGSPAHRQDRHEDRTRGGRGRRVAARRRGLKANSFSLDAPADFPETSELPRRNLNLKQREGPQSRAFFVYGLIFAG